jgi:hypothetical protein
MADDTDNALDVTTALAPGAAQDDEDPQEAARYWLSEISVALRKAREWQTRGDRVIRRYKDERADNEMMLDQRGRRMNLLWSNVETSKPAYYSHRAAPNISRRNKDNDLVGRSCR